MKQMHCLLVLLSCTFTSCYHIYYSPNTPNTPLLSQKNEVRVNGLIGTGANSEYTSGELQLAYAATNHIGVMVNGFTASKSEANNEGFTEKGNGSYAEVAPGFFTPLSKNGKWIAEVYAGAGTGTVTNGYPHSSSSKVGVTKTFIQPAIGYKARNFEVAFVPKFSFVDWKVKEDKVNETDNSVHKQDLLFVKNTQRFTAFEPSVIMRAGGENVKVQLGITFSNLNRYYFESVENGLVSLGISLNLNRRKNAEGVNGK